MNIEVFWTPPPLPLCVSFYFKQNIAEKRKKIHLAGLFRFCCVWTIFLFYLDLPVWRKVDWPKPWNRWIPDENIREWQNQGGVYWMKNPGLTKKSVIPECFYRESSKTFWFFAFRFYSLQPAKFKFFSNVYASYVLLNREDDRILILVKFNWTIYYL